MGGVLWVCVTPCACDRAEPPATRRDVKQMAPVTETRVEAAAPTPVEPRVVPIPGPARPTAVSITSPLPPEAVAVRIRDAFLHQRFLEVWGLMSQSAQERFLRDLPQTRPSRPTGAGDLFVRWWQEQLAASPTTPDEIRASTITGVKVTGAVATVTVRDRDGRDQHMELILEHGHWKLNRMPE